MLGPRANGLVARRFAVAVAVAVNVNGIEAVVGMRKLDPPPIVRYLAREHPANAGFQRFCAPRLIEEREAEISLPVRDSHLENRASLRSHTTHDGQISKSRSGIVRTTDCCLLRLIHRSYHCCNRADRLLACDRSTR